MPNTIALLSSTTVTTPVATVSINSIPQTYTDLLLYVSSRTTDTTSSNMITDVLVRFNGSTSNYQQYFSRNNTNSPNSFTNTPASYAYGLAGAGRNATANTFGSASMYIPNYTVANSKNHFIKSAVETNVAAFDSANLIVAGTWNDTAAITSIVLFEGYANFATNTTINLYGIIKS
jgi:hypothetical protein